MLILLKSKLFGNAGKQQTFKNLPQNWIGRRNFIFVIAIYSNALKILYGYATCC